MSKRQPKYRLHKPTHQAVVSLDGRDYYLGRYGSTASKQEYDRLVGLWLANGRRLPQSRESSDVTITELMVHYMRHVAGYTTKEGRHVPGYYIKNGKPTSEVTVIKNALKVLKRLYGPTPAREFGPLALEVVQSALIEDGLCRREVNRRTGLVTRFFRWCVSKQLVPAEVHHALKTFSGLRKGRSGVRESAPVKPVPEAWIAAVEPYVARQIWAMIQLQLLTGMRPAEATIMRGCDLDTSDAVWLYHPESHKTEHLERERVVYLGPQAQAIVRPWLRTELTAYLFSPREAMAEHRAEERRRRKTRVQPSQQHRAKPKPEKAPGAHYTTESYRRAIAYACDRATEARREQGVEPAEVPHWGPNRLRHNAGTRLRRDHGLDMARCILGHSSPVVTEHYAELDRDKARAIMLKIG